MKRMLINATQQEELRVALVDGQHLYDLDIENSGSKQKKSNIYKGKITRIEPSLEAVFIDYGSEKHGFLPLKEISQSYFPINYDFNSRSNVKDILKEGQEIIVQINKEERGTKGAALTTFISLAGSYLVLMPNNPKCGGISRRIEGNDRNEIKELLLSLKIPDSMGLIIRTAGAGKSIQSLQWDLSFRLQHWNTIQKMAKNRPAPFLIHQDNNVLVRAFRDYLRQDIGEILIDDSKIFNLAHNHIKSLGRPDFINKIKLYTGSIPLFSYFQIESQINSAFQRKVRLPSGGSIIIDTTEALTAIDINSSRSTKNIDIETTAFNTNFEAVHEISRQLRLRDLGGLIVIDFIDMMHISHQKLIENKLREIVREDRARIQIGKISRFGLLEMSRQRISSSLGESSHHICPRCAGSGAIRDNASLSLSILRLIEEEALKENTYEVHAIVPVEIACYLLNEKRKEVYAIEKRQAGGKTIIIPNKNMKTPNYSVSRIKKRQKNLSMDYSFSKIKKNNFLHSFKNQSTEKKIKKKPILNNVNLSYFYNRRETVHKNNKFIKKKYSNTILNAVFINNIFILKMISWIKNSFLFKRFLITSNIFKKNTLQKKSIQLKKEYQEQEIRKINKNISKEHTHLKSIKNKKIHENIYNKKLKNLEIQHSLKQELSPIFFDFIYKKKYTYFNVNKNIQNKCIFNLINKNFQILKICTKYKQYNEKLFSELQNYIFNFLFSLEFDLIKIWNKQFINSSNAILSYQKNNNKNIFYVFFIIEKYKTSINQMNFFRLLAKKTNINKDFLTKKSINKQNLLRKNCKHKKNDLQILNKNIKLSIKNNDNIINKKNKSSAPITKISENLLLINAKKLISSNLFIAKRINQIKNSAGAHSATNCSSSPILKIK